jgi:hypothetical protein
LRLFKAIPISSRHAKDAVVKAAEALRRSLSTVSDTKKTPARASLAAAKKTRPRTQKTAGARKAAVG